MVGAAKPESSKPIQIIGFAPVGEMVTSGSPYVAKLEVMARMAGLPYCGYLGTPADKKAAPRGKVPSMKHGQDFVSDSCAIVSYLTKKYPSEMEIFTPADPKQAALTVALQRLLEEHLYYIMMWYFWQHPALSQELPPRIVANLGFPRLVQPLLRRALTKQLRRNLHFQGIGRMPMEEVRQRAEQDLDVLEVLLKDSKYLTGATPTAADAFLFALIDMAHGALAGLKSQGVVWDLIAARPKIVTFYDRVKADYFPDGVSKEWKEKFRCKMSDEIE